MVPDFNWHTASGKNTAMILVVHTIKDIFPELCVNGLRAWIHGLKKITILFVELLWNIHCRYRGATVSLSYRFHKTERSSGQVQSLIHERIHCEHLEWSTHFSCIHYHTILVRPIKPVGSIPYSNFWTTLEKQEQLKPVVYLHRTSQIRCDVNSVGVDRDRTHYPHDLKTVNTNWQSDCLSTWQSTNKRLREHFWKLGRIECSRILTSCANKLKQPRTHS